MKTNDKLSNTLCFANAYDTGILQELSS